MNPHYERTHCTYFDMQMFWPTCVKIVNACLAMRSLTPNSDSTYSNSS